ncbi:MAG: 23S rRNA (adenine(2503)-C(2))-methyltransferase RlmN [Lachnospiraceae bacterium]|nr:23S rRNA (adenine(2503)-C(2))-methyltransferase RlmN [Lachnospiraceae bacterium]
MDIKSMTIEELSEVLRGLGQPAYRAKQLYSWLHVRLASDYGEMSNLPKDLREALAAEYPLTVLTKVVRLDSALDETKKYLFRLPDGNVIESVRMEYHHGVSVCISSQVGCRMGCSFCASTIGGLVRNLTPSEMLEQVYAITRDSGARVDNIVVMGSGEPLDNYENLLRFIKMVTDENGLHISQRNITVSTCGLAPMLRKLAEEHLAITPAVSLHAPNDELRKQLMPVAKAYSLRELMAAAWYYAETTGRRMTFEYSLIEGVNDTPQLAKELAGLLKGRPAHVNLIPVNPVTERNYRRSLVKNVLQFQKMLENEGIHVTIRRELGSDIDAACGQLRRHYEESKQELKV